MTSEPPRPSEMSGASAEELTALPEELRLASRTLAPLLEHTSVCVYVKDLDGRFLLINPPMARLLGRPPSEVVGRTSGEIFAHDDADALRQHDHQALAHGAPIEHDDTVVIDGERRFLHTVKFALRDETGAPFAVCGISVDVSEQRRAREALSRAEERFRGLVELSPDALVGGTPSGRITFANAAVHDLFGYRADELIGQPVELLWPERFRSRYRELLGGILDDRPTSGPSLTGEYALRRRDGTEFLAQVSSRWVDTDDGPISVSSLRDVSERDRVENLLRTLAERDALTGLLGRRRFEEELSTELARAERYGHSGALLAIDLDRFKSINDSLGHRAGDELLRTVADRLRSRLRESDVLARLGGDEFGALLPEASLAEARSVASGLLQVLRAAPFALEGQALPVTASVGVTAFGQRSASAEALLMEADVAMYEAKETGRDRSAVYTGGGRARMEARVGWAERIRRALEEDGFTVHAQPILDLSASEVMRYELLLRLADATGALRLPALFLPIAERFDLMRAIDRWTTRRAIALLARPGAQGEKLQVNLSGVTVGDEEFVEIVERECTAAGAAPGALVFEITETAAIVNLDDARRFAGALRRLGCAVALDDFGRGFSSFYYLRHLPVDIVKIDGEFIRDLAREPSDQLLVRSMVEMAHGLGLRVVGEFVGDEETLELLRSYGADFAQGHHLGAPAPVEEVLGG